MKKTIIFLIFLFIFNGCLIEEPKIDIADIRLDGISEGKINLKLLLNVYNPNSFDAKLRYIEYNFYYDKNLFSSGIWEGDERLNANSSTNIPITISLEEGIIIKFVSLLFKGKTQEIQSKIYIEGKAVVNKYGKNFTYNFKWKYKEKKEAPQEKKLDTEPIH
ncbi:MAG: LEA type 2 family protein [Proteobacteria bacterium]|nr:LEA type 2 family protein [Pseudomonadota bacterium]